MRFWLGLLKDAFLILLVVWMVLAASLVAIDVRAAERGPTSSVVCFYRHYPAKPGPRQHPTVVRICRTFGVRYSLPPGETFVILP